MSTSPNGAPKFISLVVILRDPKVEIEKCVHLDSLPTQVNLYKRQALS